MQQLSFHWADFHEILYLSIFKKSIEKIQVSLKLDKKEGYFTCRKYTFLKSCLTQFCLKVVEKLKTRVLFSTTFLKSCAVYEM
jgi:hypothetical protein